jgi:hypothetical protein
VSGRNFKVHVRTVPLGSVHPNLVASGLQVCEAKETIPIANHVSFSPKQSMLSERDRRPVLACAVGVVYEAS